MAKLPDIPKGRDLEWSVAAALQTSGYYIDKNVAEKFEGSNLLELDAVATSYATGKRSEVLMEVKGGKDWGFEDFFQLRGRMHYRGIDNGILFVTQRSANRQKAYEAVARRLGLKFIVCSNPRSERVQAALAAAGVETSNDIVEHDFWRFVYWTERTLADLLVEVNKESRTPISLAAKRYHYVINDHIFFLTNALERADALYSAYIEMPKISQEAVAEALAKPSSDEDVYRKYYECINTGAHPLVQACLYLEHRARLAILRAAVDYACFQHDKSKDHGDAFKSLPNNFGNIVTSLEGDVHAYLYPFFWQVFFWAWMTSLKML